MAVVLGTRSKIDHIETCIKLFNMACLKVNCKVCDIIVKMYFVRYIQTILFLFLPCIIYLVITLTKYYGYNKIINLINQLFKHSIAFQITACK